MTNTNYYSAFIDSILSLPVGTRREVLDEAMKYCSNNNPYQYLFEEYMKEEDNESGSLHKLLDDHCLAID
jgi:hypothetical protein